MFFDILKKDLKRGRTMNTIILLFVIISVMFIAGSVNCIISVTTSLDTFFEKAGIPNLMAGVMDKVETTPLEEDIREHSDLYSKIEYEELTFIDPRQVTFSDGTDAGFDSNYIIESIDSLKEKIFDKNNEPLTEVHKGEAYVAEKMLNLSDIKIGDTIVIHCNDYELSLKVAGSFKDAPLGSVLMGMGRIMINDEDCATLYEKAKEVGLTGKLYLLHTDSPEKLQNIINELPTTFIFMGTIDFVKSSYLMDMIVAMLLMVVSIILIAVALIVLRFTISFTISSEFREIGVMKAIGITDMKIRSLYLVKYLAISIFGTMIGIIISFPFTSFLINLSSNTIMMDEGGSLLINIVCGIAVIIIIMLFGLLCTRKAKKLSPIDAIRNGQSGERFRKKGFLRLNKTRLRPTTFLAGNDVLSSKKKYLLIIVIIILTMLPVQFLDIVSSTLGSKEILSTLGMVSSHAAFSLNYPDYNYTTDGSGKQLLENKLSEIEKKLNENGIPARVHMEIFLSSKEEYKGKTTKVLALQGVGTKTTEYRYIKGSAPKAPDEIAIQPNTAKDLGADIGDTISVYIGNQKYDMLITGFYNAITNMGQGIRLYEGLDVDYNYNAGTFGTQLSFTDNPSDKEIQDRLEKIKELFPELSDFKTGGELAESITSVGPMFRKMVSIFLILSIIIIVMVAVLMERSMVIKETGEIATIKAIGFTDWKVVKWHGKRFLFTGIVSAVISGLLALPLTKLCATPVFAFMGSGKHIKYSLDIPRICIIYPVMIMFFMVVSVWITAIQTRKITAQQASCIE